MDTMAVFGRFCEQAPFAAMTPLIARSWIDEEFPSIFDEHRGDCETLGRTGNRITTPHEVRPLGWHRRF